jgi:hypothetical protein
MSNYYKNVIRTFVPVLVASVIAYLTKLEKHVPAGELAILLPIISTVYYAAVRQLEVKFPKLSWLLGALPVKAAGTTPTK